MKYQLEFLFQALVKTSRLETGVIQLDKKTGRLFDTVAQACLLYTSAKTIPMPEDSGASRHCAYLVVDGVNPGLIDLFTRQARKAMQEQQKSSVLQKLRQEPSIHKPAAVSYTHLDVYKRQPQGGGNRGYRQ